MRMYLRFLVAGLVLALACGGCAAHPAPADAGAASPGAPEPVSTPSPEPQPGENGLVLPVTEEGIRALYGWEGCTVRAVTPCEGDFLVEYGYGEEGASLLAWVFGSTGRRVQLTGMTDFTSYAVTGPGQVRYTDTGVSLDVPWKGMPQEHTVQVLGDGNRLLTSEWPDVIDTAETVWLDPAEPFSMGAWDADGLAFYERYEQLYDARIDADGLSFSFIPSGESVERFQSFFPACTTIPCWDAGLDPETRVWTLRLYNTSLESGGDNALLAGQDGGWGELFQDYGVSYPYAFPAGPLGRDSHFLTDVSIAQDGEDTVVTAVLTDKAYRFTVESSNLGLDNIPSFRIIFREYSWEMDEAW